MSTTDPPGAQHPAATTPTDPAAPLPIDVQPFPVACPCLNVTVAGYANNTLVAKYNDGKAAAFGERAEVWLPANGEIIKHMPMSTFDQVGDEAWRKCWVCETRVYRVKGPEANDKIAPINTWVEVDLSNGIMYGDKVDEAKQRTPLVYSGLLLDLPATSTFGRPPSSTTPVPYPAEPPTPNVLLPAIPDPFFLPPPFIPNHPALREMCKAAVVALQERHDEIERDIRSYIVQRAQDMKRLEDQVRAEVEALWDRYAQGPLGGVDVDRRGSVALALRSSASSRAVSGSGPLPTESIEQVASAFDRERQKDSMPSGVVPDPPSIGTQFNAHTTVAASSLLSASLATNTFHAPPSRRAAQNVQDIEALAKTASRDGAVSREVAMSFAFSAMEEHAGAMRRRESAAERKQEDLKETAAVEEEAEEREKGIDSWIAMERSQATQALKDAAGTDAKTVTAQPDDANIVANGSSKDKKAARAHVTFQEPDKAAKEKEPKPAEEDDAIPDDDDDDYVFDMDTDDGPARVAVEQLAVKAPERNQVRSMVEDNLSRTFAAEAPSHRAAWRVVEQRGVSSVLRRSPQSGDGDDDEYTPSDIGLARSVPVNITKPQRTGAPLERKTSLSDKHGLMVPGLIGAMRERGVERSAPRAIVGSLAKVSTTIGRRGSRSASGDRQRDQVKSYAADPGAVFESLAEGAVDSDEDEDDEDPAPLPTNGKFVPPHVIAQRKAARESRSLA